MEFYPLIFEEESTSDITQKDLAKATGKYVGAIGGNIILDPHDDSIISVNKNRENTPINSWEDVEDLKQYKGYMIDFLNELFKKNKLNIDINKVLADIKKNIQKEREQAKGKAKTWQPLEIPNFPLKGLKYSDFWEYQLAKYNDEIEGELDKIRGKKDQKKNDYTPRNSKDERRISELNIPPSLNEFYAEKGKKKEWDDFIKNVEKSGLSTIGSLSHLFGVLAHVLQGTIGENPIYGATRVKIKVDTEKDVEDFKKDMIDFIAKYGNKDIKKINDDGAYDKILDTGSFLNILMVTEPKGVGRGEILMAYIMKDARFAGGGESFDVTCDGTTYELKDYSDTGGSIRLGTHGKLTRFDWWKEIEKTVATTRKILKELGPDDLKALLGNNNFFTIWKYIATDKSYLEDKRAIGTAVEAGELNAERLERLKAFYGLAHELISGDTKSGEEGKYTYAVVKGSDVKPETVNIEPVNHDHLEKSDSLHIEGTKDNSTKLKELASLKYVKNPLQLQKDLDEVGKEYNKGANNVDYFMVFFPKKVIIEKPETFVHDTITQSSIKIVHKDGRSKDKGEQNADKTFKKWKDQKDKSYYEVYKDVIHGDDEYIDESYYPLLRKY